MTKLTLKNEYGKYSVEHPCEDLGVLDMVALFKQVMLAATYQKESLDEVLGEE